MNVLCSYGAPSWNDCNGTTTNETSNFRTWNPGAELWEGALANRISRAAYMTFDPDDQSSFATMKKALLNGYVLSFNTNFDGWRYMNSKSPVVEQVCASVNGSTGGHCLTIVGYNDDLWTDINRNNIQDEGETGAFKVANSWGTSYKNEGFVWLAYDALKAVSSVSGAYNTNREGAVWGNEVYFLEPQVSYTPSLVAEVTLNTARRNQIGVEIGVSPASASAPTVTRDVVQYTYSHMDEPGVDFTQGEYIAFHYPNQGTGAGENYNFTTGKSAADGSFSFDLTPLMADYFAAGGSGTEPLRYYVRVDDNLADGSPAILKSFRLHDRAGGQTVTAAQQNLSADGKMVTAYADYASGGAPQNLTAAVSGGALEIGWSAVEGAESYTVEVNGDTYPADTAGYAYTPVTPGRLYHIRVRAEGEDTVGDWSEPLNLSYCLYGDVNRDGRIEESDMEMVYEANMDRESFDDEQQILGDVDENGEITMADVREIYKYINKTATTGNTGEEVIFTNTDRAVRFLKYGDVDKDGKVTEDDITLIYDGANGVAVYDNEQYILADVDSNRKINGSDVIFVYDFINSGKNLPAGTYAAFYAD